MKCTIRHRLFTLLVLSIAFAAGASRLSAQDVQGLVNRAVHNELTATNAGHPFRFRLHKVDEKGATTKEIIETRDGDVARLIERDDKPLPPDQQQAELNRLNDLLNHPETQEHRRKREQEDTDRANKMLKLLPNAFVYTSQGTVDGPSGPVWRLTFQPNPNFNPPDRESEVFHGMAGELWIDKAQERMVRLDAHLIADVDFGWGILGRLYKGGTIVIEQKDVGDHHWEQTHMKLNLNGKALMLKSIVIQTTEDSSGFQPVPRDIGYQDAIRLLQSGDSHGQLAEKQ